MSHYHVAKPFPSSSNILCDLLTILRPMEGMDTVEEGGLTPVDSVFPSDQVNDFGKHTISSSESDGDDEAEGTPDESTCSPK